MITAKEAKDIVKEHKVKAIEEQIILIESKIRNAASKGETTFYYEGIIYPEVMQLLLDSGYTIKNMNSYRECYTEIKWEE